MIGPEGSFLPSSTSTNNGTGLVEEVELYFETRFASMKLASAPLWTRARVVNVAPLEMTVGGGD